MIAGVHLWRAEEHEPLTATEWDAAKAKEAMAEIVADAEHAATGIGWPGHPRDDSDETEVAATLYLGAAGMVWGLHQLGSELDGAEVIERALGRYRQAPEFGDQAHSPSLWMGETGLLVVAKAIGAPVYEAERLSDLIRANREHETWELMWGSPGTILAARVCELQIEWTESEQLLYASWDPATDTWPYHLYGQRLRYLSPAHGFAGNVHVLRGFIDEDVLRERTTRVLTRLAEHEDGLVNWPPLDASFAELAAQIRVQWCHGAPGLVSTLGELMPLELARAGGELTWAAGPLGKGPSLCHGTAGNGYAFLKLHALTGEAMWLERARRFAMHAIEQVRAERERVGRGRYTLWTGDIGVALYLRSCLDGSPEFPTIDYF
jgi:hypothetical protein